MIITRGFTGRLVTRGYGVSPSPITQTIGEASYLTFQTILSGGFMTTADLTSGLTTITNFFTSFITSKADDSYLVKEIEKESEPTQSIEREAKI